MHEWILGFGIAGAIFSLGLAAFMGMRAIDWGEVIRDLLESFKSC